MTATSSDPTLTDRMADFATDTTFEDLADDVVDEAKRGLLDTIGVILVGAADPATGIVRSVIAADPTGVGSTVAGSAVTASMPLAALVNGYAAHVMDYDDTQHRVGTHMSAPVVGAALPMAESLHRSGRDLIAAYAIGFEVGCRLGRANSFARHLSKRKIHATGYLGHFGATVAGGRLTGLDGVQMRRSFGIAAGYASGTMRSFGTMGKAQNAANAAQNGVYSAMLAERGFTAPEDIFDGDGSIFTMCGGQTDAGQLLDGLGKEYEVTTNTRKEFACAGWRNPIVDASMRLVNDHGLKVDDIESVHVWAAPNVSHLPNYPVPTSGLESKFSAQYAAAVALCDLAGGAHQFSDERVADPAVIDLCRRTALSFDQDFGPFQIRIELKTHDGKDLSQFIPVQKGDYKNPLSWDDLMVKFKANAATVLPADSVDELGELIRNLETVDDVATLARLLRT